MRKLRKESGYSLVEVLVAMGIFGAVVMSIMTLFYMGQRNITSGKKMSEGVAAATKVDEDLSGMTRQSVYDAFKIDDTTALTTITTDSGQGAASQGQYANSIRRSTDTISATTEFGYNTGILSRWKGLLYLPDTTGTVPIPVPGTQVPRFDSGLIELVITPTNWTDAAKKMTTATVLKLRIIVSWNEGRKRRQVALDSTIVQSF
jgi:type II secretory pathway pseudopilin PulG